MMPVPAISWGTGDLPPSNGSAEKKSIISLLIEDLLLRSVGELRAIIIGRIVSRAIRPEAIKASEDHPGSIMTVPCEKLYPFNGVNCFFELGESFRQSSQEPS